MPDLHALLSASSSQRWLSCPPSARLEEKFPDTTSPAAEEGTLAHAIAAERLLQYIATGKPGKTSPEYKLHELYRPVMEDYVDDFAGFVINEVESLRSQDPFTTLYVEQLVEYDHIAPEGFGTSDVIIIGDGILHVIDFKYGKGVRVDAKRNSQMMLYGLGARRKFRVAEVDLVIMTIHQPRMGNIESYSMSYNDLLIWGLEYALPRAIKAHQGEGEFQAGDHCKFCKVAATCTARAKYQLELTRFEFRPAPLLTPDDIGEILAQVDDLLSWAKSIKEYATQRALEEGETFTGWKLVEGRANRVIKDPAGALQKLLDAGFGYDQVVDLVGLTKLEDIVGKKRLQDVIGELIEKPEGKPTLVRDTDRRPTYTHANQDFKENE